MRKCLLVIAALAVLFSCEKIPDQEFGMGFGAGTSFNFTVSSPKDGFYKFHNGWQQGDVVFIFLKDITSGYLRMEYDGKNWSINPAGSIEMKDMLNNGRKTSGAIALLNGSDIHASYDNGVWVFNHDHAYRYFTAGPSTYTFDQDGRANYSFTGTIELTAPAAPGNAAFVLVEQPSGEEDFLPSLISDSFMPVMGISGFGNDGNIRTSSSLVAGTPVQGRPWEEGGRKYSLYEVGLASPVASVRDYLPGDYDWTNREKENGYGYLYELDYGKRSFALFRFSTTALAANSETYLPKRPVKDWSKSNGIKDGWCPFKAESSDLGDDDFVFIYGTGWATCNYMTDKPWEMGSTIDVSKAGDYVKKYSKSKDLNYPGYQTISSFNDNKHLRYSVTAHGVNGYMYVDPDTSGSPMVFFPDKSGKTRYYFATWNIFDPLKLEDWSFEIAADRKHSDCDGDIYLRVRLDG